jgi:2-oxoglutaroyl-CoA hydrolase
MTQLFHLAQRLSGDIDGFRVEISETDSRADIVLDRPPFNLISMVQRDQLRAVFEALDDDPRVRVIVVRAEGEHFSGGCDLEGPIDASPEFISRLGWNLNSPSRCSKPVIAANRGYCFGVGFELSLACDFRIATETTLYSLPAQKLCQMAGAGGSARLQKMVGSGRTKDIVMRSRRIDGARAYDWGIATEFVVDTELESMTAELVRELLACSPLVQRSAKKLLNDIEDAVLPAAIEPEGHSSGRLRCLEGAHEGIEVFRHKRSALVNGK